ncbi:MAG: SusC/RagA family TonB-linked outer membrane protein [Bacteroidaceae bacterium]|nr:SusC/RagA family TonB-linked outer membrane protein [Bacteroidaceae bacterium]
MSIRNIIAALSIWLAPFTLLAQTPAEVLRGQVLDELGEPLIGATLKLKKTGQGTVTDMDGRYQLSAEDGDAVTISYIGYQPQTIAVRRLSGMKVVRLQPDVHQNLSEVVVTGMQRMDKRLFTGATTQVNATDAKIDGMPDISRSLEGRAAGVSVQNISGTFGTAPKIRIRGATSIYGSSKPLWVVDGVIIDDVTDISADDLSSGDAETLISSAIAGLNPDDIESFQILKDGSATSIYGARAMAGVIVITTKRGTAGKSHVSYTGEYTMRLKPRYNEFNIMNSQEQMSVYQELFDKGWLNFSDTYRAAKSGVYGKMYQLANSYDPATGMYALSNTEEARNAYLREAEYRNTDWFDELFSNSIMNSHSASISGGTEKVSFYGSLSALFDPGWYRQSKVERYTANMNTSIKMSDHLTLNLITMGSYRKQRAPGTLSQSTDVVNGEVKRDFDINPYSYAINSSRTLDPDVFYTRNYTDFNIKHELDNNYIDIDKVDLKFQGELKWKPLRELEFSALGAVQYSSATQEHQVTEQSNQAGAYRAMPDAVVREKNPWLYQNPDLPNSTKYSILPTGGMYLKTDNKMRSIDFRATGNWNHVFADTHIVNLFAGTEIGSVDRQRNYMNGWGMQYDKGELPFYTVDFFKKSLEDGSNYYTLNHYYNRSVAFFGNATYSYDARYTLNGTLRYEGTNRLGPSRQARWLPTWNVSGAWNLHEERFSHSIEKVLSHLSLKASYSLTADPGPSSVSNATVVLRNYKPYRPFTNIQESGMEIETPANESLTYEKKHELNLGIDMGFLGNRISVAFDWFRRDNFDLIGLVYTSGMGGAISKMANVASMSSHGEELSITSKNFDGKNFKWETNFIFSHATTEITDLQSSADIISLVSGRGFALEGYPARSLFSFRFDGLTSEGLPRILNQDGEVVSNGETINFQSQLLDNLIYEGPTDPTITGSLGNVFRYKGFRLNLFITYAFGNVVRLNPAFSSSYSDLDALPREFRNRWMMPGDEAQTDIPVILTKRQSEQDSYMSVLYNAYNYSTARMAKGDFIRMKEISLSYDFPKTWIQHLRISDLSLKLQATNLFLIYSDKKLNGQDPEFFQAGGVSAPVPKQFTLTLRLGI